MLDARARARRLPWGWLLLALLALFAYAFSLGGIHVPKIGDEYVYLQISRVTGAQDWILPLSWDEGVWSTKPPMLFWQGMLTAKLLGRELAFYRLPNLLYTLATAFLAGRFAWRASGSLRTGLIAGLSFLAFFSTYRYGRTFLTNSPEVCFTFAAVYAVTWWREEPGRTSWGKWVAVGLLLAMVSLYRSIVLLAPFSLATATVLWLDRGGDWRGFLRRDLAKVALAGALCLLGFAVWFLLDPDPAEVFQTFLVGEHGSKMDLGQYLKGIVSGHDNVFRLWLAHAVNAAVFAVPVLAVYWDGFRRRRELTREERILWVYVLAYLLVFSLPSKRSPSYVMSGMPAIAVLMGMAWDRFRPRTFYVALVPFLFLFLAAWYACLRIERAEFLEPYPLWHWTVLAAALGLTVLALARVRLAPCLLHLLALLAWLGFAGAVWPLETGRGRFSPETVAGLRGAELTMPGYFRCRYERYYFLLDPGVVHGYDPRDEARRDELMATGVTIGVYAPLEGGEPVGYRVLGSRVDMRTRHSSEEMRQIAFEDRLDLLFHRELIVVRE